MIKHYSHLSQSLSAESRHMTGFLYPSLLSCVGSCHSDTEAVNGLILKMESLNLAADVKSKIEGY